MGHVEHIHIAPYEAAPMRRVDEVEARKGVGLAGDRKANLTGGEPAPGREVTLVEAEEVERLASEHGIDLGPGGTRRNITTRGVRLNDLVGRTFRVGDVVMTGQRLCEPCEHLQAMTGRPVLKLLTHRAGLRATLVTSGVVRVGDAVELVAEPVEVPTQPAAR